NLGVFGSSTSGTGVYGFSPNLGVFGSSTGSTGSTGVYGFSTGSFGAGVYGNNGTGIGVIGVSAGGIGVYGATGDGFAGKFSGNVQITGSLIKSGGGFTIDHPLDLANKYLSHSFVESPDMKNLYDG